MFLSFELPENQAIKSLDTERSCILLPTIGQFLQSRFLILVANASTGNAYVTTVCLGGFAHDAVSPWCHIYQ